MLHHGFFRRLLKCSDYFLQHCYVVASECSGWMLGDFSLCQVKRVSVILDVSLLLCIFGIFFFHLFIGAYGENGASDELVK